MTNNKVSIYMCFFFFAQQRSIERWHVGVLRDTAFQEIRPPGVGFETGDFVQEKFRGEATV